MPSKLYLSDMLPPDSKNSTWRPAIMDVLLSVNRELGEWACSQIVQTGADGKPQKSWCVLSLDAPDEVHEIVDASPGVAPIDTSKPVAISRMRTYLAKAGENSLRDNLEALQNLVKDAAGRPALGANAAERTVKG